MHSSLLYAEVLDTHVEAVAVRTELLRCANPVDDEHVDSITARLTPIHGALARFETLQCLPHQILRERLALSAQELSVVWLLAAIALRPSVRRAALAFAGEGTYDPSTAAIGSLIYGRTPSAEAIMHLAATGTLRRLQIIERSDGGAPDVHDTRQTWCLSPRVLAWLHGDSRVQGSAVREHADQTTELLALHPDVAGSLASTRLQHATFVACGLRGLGRRTALRGLADKQSVVTLDVDAATLPKAVDDLKAQLRRIARECKLLGRAPLICNIDALVDDKGQTRVDLVGSELVSEIEGPVFVTCGVNRPAMRWGRPTVVIAMKPPTGDQRAALWLNELGQGTLEDGEHLATMYPLAPALIHHAAKAAKAHASGRVLEPEDICAGVRAVLDDRLGDYAKRVEITQTWSDLVLPDDQREAIQYLIARIRQGRTVFEQWGFAAKVGKGLGTSALFSGPPGTGKTMCAALIAKELGLELYQVDMAKVVSKWIGESERNLAALFDAAEAGHAILLFDEADSLFGKRTDVKSSNDRYANLETNYLLQRLESFTGICLLTSNHESNIDAAFQRRLALHVRFDLPDVGERAALWRAMLPAAAPVADGVDMSALARRFAMSGGYIRNAALRAAFLAADDGSPITVEHLERAAKLEYEGMGKIAA